MCERWENRADGGKMADEELLRGGALERGGDQKVGWGDSGCCGR